MSPREHSPEPIQLPGGEGRLRAQLVERVERAGRSGLAERELLQSLAEWPPAEVKSALAELEAAGLVVEWARRIYALRHSEWSVGVVETLESGDALARTGARGEAGFYLPRRALKGAADGDTVLLKRLQRKAAARKELEALAKLDSRAPIQKEAASLLQGL